GEGRGEVLVNFPVRRGVKVLRQRKPVQSDPPRHLDHPRHRRGIQREMLRDLRMRVSVDPLQAGASALELSTVVHGVEDPVVQGAFQPRTSVMPNVHNIVLLGYYRTTNIVLLGMLGGLSVDGR